MSRRLPELLSNCRAGLVLLVAAMLQSGCYRQYPPQRPAGVPADAVWAGGWDGGGWVLCATSTLEYNECAIFDEAGKSRGPKRYVLNGLSRAARPDELRYKYLTGAAIGLENGRELVVISQK